MITVLRQSHARNSRMVIAIECLFSEIRAIIAGRISSSLRLLNICEIHDLAIAGKGEIYSRQKQELAKRQSDQDTSILRMTTGKTETKQDMLSRWWRNMPRKGIISFPTHGPGYLRANMDVSVKKYPGYCRFDSVNKTTSSSMYTCTAYMLR